MKILVIILGGLLSSELLYSQTGTPPIPHLNYCIKTKLLKRIDLKSTFPFDKTNKIQFVSFRSDNESMPMRNGSIDTTGFIEIKTLKRKDEDKLIDILYNYNFDPKVNKDSIVLETMVCYEPRNAVIFKDKRNEIISYVEICFECLKYRKPSELNIGEFCQDKYSLLKNFFGQMGIKFGITELE